MYLNPLINIYTDGSCHTQMKIGSWVSIIFINNEKIILSGTILNTTHQRMEITAVVEGLKYVLAQLGESIPISVISDSQYVIELPLRKLKLQAKNFLTNKGNEIINLDLVKAFYNVIEHLNITFTKTKAHQRKADVPNYNIEADHLSRKLVREAVINAQS